MNMMVLSVSSLVKHIILEILIPRVKKDRDGSEEYIQSFINLANDDDRCYKLAHTTVSGIKDRLRYIRQEDLEDFMSNVISSTIQTGSNQYHRFLKSRNGFWTSTFDMESNKSCEEFCRTFSYFFFKAVQSESRSLSYRLKHEVNTIDNEDGETTIISGLEDKRKSEEILESFSKFEEYVDKIKLYAEKTDDFDDLDRKIFKTWMAQKDNGNFTESVNMLKTVYKPIIDELKSNDVEISASALHFRWNRIRLFLKDATLA